jgi:penicillin amidase
MPLRARRTLATVLAILLALMLVLGGAGLWTVRRSFPQTRGQLTLPGLQAPVEVLRDAYGIPQIYASSTHDLFMAQGYVHAQERFWQMDFWRHIGSGRLSEMFGSSQIDTDSFLRTLGWAEIAQQELDQIDPNSLAILQAYAQGVNAYLADHKGSAISLEYAILGLLNRGYAPEPWTPIHSLTWAKAMAWDLRGNMDEEIDRALLLKTLSPQQVDELYPPYPSDHPLILPPGSYPQAGASFQIASTSAAAELSDVRLRFAGLDDLLASGGAGLGSNNWVLSGTKTDSGYPILANDPHLSSQMPSIWFEIGLHCQPHGPECPFEVTGFSFAGAPGVIIGHNDRIAWGFTNTGPDVMDLYIERLNPDDPNQYEVNGQWVDMTVRKETISVSDGDPVTLTVRSTRHGPVISDSYGDLKDFAAQSGMQLPDHFAIALRWTALQPTFTFRAIWNMDIAQNWEEFRQAARDFAVPSQNFVYADVDGNIGYQMPGLIPIRASGDGRYPVPGWTDDHEWTGFIPFDELPSALNPPEGFIATANNQVIGSSYPYLITMDWDYGFRAQRIIQMIQAAPGPISKDDIQRMQGDDRSLLFDTFGPIIASLPVNEPRLVQARQLLEGWDGQEQMDRPAPALFEAFWRHLLADTFDDDLPQDFWPQGDSRWLEVVRRLASRPDSAWWDDHATPAIESLQDMAIRAFKEAVDELSASQGSDPTAWQWGKMHTNTFRNGTLGKSGIAPIEALFNRGPYPVSGGASIVNATNWDASLGYQVTSLPSMRMIVDLADLSQSRSIHTTGESGHAFDPHYTDMVDLWRTIQYHPMLWTREQIEAAAVDRLTMQPAP